VRAGREGGGVVAMENGWENFETKESPLAVADFVENQSPGSCDII
jgi:hypothetical protein